MKPECAESFNFSDRIDFHALLDFARRRLGSHHVRRLFICFDNIDVRIMEEIPCQTSCHNSAMAQRNRKQNNTAQP
jgi:hypothetical protein